jgi:hypothetical protein
MGNRFRSVVFGVTLISVVRAADLSALACRARPAKQGKNGAIEVIAAPWLRRHAGAGIGSAIG